MTNTKKPETHSTTDIKAEYCLVQAADDIQSPTSWHRYLLNMASVFAETDGATHRYISFYALLGAIATLAGSVKNEKAEDAAKEIMRQYGSEDNPRFGEDFYSPVERGNGSNHEAAQNEFSKLFAKWSWGGPEQPVPLLVLSESWNRFASATKQLKQKHKGTIKLGEYLQDCIILYLGHLLEYEMDIMNIKSTTKHDGNDIIEKRFASNISSYKNDRENEKCMIFDYVFSCPIWMYFLDMNNNKKVAYTEVEVQRNIIIDYYKDKVNAIKVEGTNRKKTNNIEKCMPGNWQNLFVFLNNTPKDAESPAELS